MEWAERLAALAPLTMAAHKHGLEADGGPHDADLFESLRRAAWASDDAEEGRTAFLEKRRPELPRCVSRWVGPLRGSVGAAG